MTSFQTPGAHRIAKLELNAKMFEFNAHLEKLADLFDSDVEAWQRLPVIVQDRSGLYRDARQQYRDAVAAGAIADDRGPSTERTTSW